MTRKRAVKGAELQPRQCSDGRWECRVITGIDPATGKSICGKTVAECRRKLTAITAKLDSGTYTEPTRMTVGQWSDIWQAEYLGDVKSSTANQYGS